MSAVGETRQQGWRTAWRVAAGSWGPLRVLFGAVLVVIMLATAGAIGLAWRLAQGPLDVTWMLRASGVLKSDQDRGRFQIGRASIAWSGFSGGAHSGLELRLDDLHASDVGGTPSASIARADVTLAALPLLSATVVPRRVVLDGVELQAVRGRDGSLRLDAGTGESAGGMDDLLGELRRPPGASTEPSLAALEQVVIEHATVTLLDEASGTSLAGEISDLDLRRREGGGITGSASGRFALGGVPVALKLSAELAADGGTHLAADLLPLGTRPIDTGLLARLDPALAGLGTLDTVLQAHVGLDLSPALRPERAELRVGAGPGTLSVPNSEPVAFDSLAATAAATWEGGAWRPSALRIDPAELVLLAGGRRSTVRLSATGDRADGHWTVRTAFGFDQAAFADLAALWPAAWGGHVRPWLTENVTGGLAHDAALTATVDVPEADPAHAKVIAAGGTLQAENVVIHWLRPVPPVDRAQAVLTVLGPDSLVIDIKRAQQGPIVLNDGVIRFTGLSEKDQYMALTASVQGAVPDVIKVLREKRLQLLDAHPIPITGSAGKVAATLAVNVPMFEHLRFEQVSIASKGRLTGLRLDGLVAGRNLTRGDVTYAVTQDGLSAAGAVTVAGLPGRADVAMDFRDGGPDEVVQRAHFVGHLGAAELAAEGIDTAGMITTGDAVADVTYTERRRGPAEVAVVADLTPAGLAVAGWRKAPGVPARAAATLQLVHGTVTAVPALSATGPGLELVARAEMMGGSPRVLRVERVVLGPTRLGGEIVFPAEPGGTLLIRASGPVVDLADQVKHLSSPGGAARSMPSMIMDVRFGQVLLGQGHTLSDVAAHVEQVGGRLRAMQATTGGREHLRASITPAPAGRRLLVHAADTGALLSGLDVTETIGGGVLAVDATFDDRLAASPLEGRLQLANFGVQNAVILGKVLQAATIYGIGDAMRREGIYFADAQIPFRLNQNVLQLGQSRASSASLGITAQGWIDFDRKLMELSGTIVPAYVLNAALGKIPLVGKLFSAERGGGLIAVGVNVSGKTADPSVVVNPLSLLTPGILRRLFGLLG